MKKSDSSRKTDKPTPSELRQIENEAVFRKANELTLKNLDKLKKMTKKEGIESLMPSNDMELHFFCECSDENCRKRIEMKLSTYKKLHKDRSKFILIPGHEATAIEKVVAKKATYNLIDKYVLPSEEPVKLNRTSVQNA